ncbi:MAG: aminoglycoside adenylyltransferase family protein [Cyanophyceae cyanobacterium]
MDNSVDRQIPQEALQACSIVQELLGTTVVGVYLFGSAVTGGLRLNSDVDVLVVVNQRPLEATRRQVIARLMEVSGRVGSADSVRPLELIVINLADVVPWRYPPKPELVYGEWLRKDFEENRVPKPEPDPDLAIVLTKVRKNSISILGSDAHQLLDPVPTEHLKLAISESLPGLVLQLKGDERNVLLTLARMWMTAATGEIVPKDVAASWAIEKLPKPCGAVLNLARRAYLGEVADYWDDDQDPEVSTLVCHMKQSIEACLGDLTRGKP